MNTEELLVLNDLMKTVAKHKCKMIIHEYTGCFEIKIEVPRDIE